MLNFFKCCWIGFIIIVEECRVKFSKQTFPKFMFLSSKFDFILGYSAVFNWVVVKGSFRNCIIIVTTCEMYLFNYIYIRNTRTPKKSPNQAASIFYIDRILDFLNPPSPLVDWRRFLLDPF